MEPKYLQYLEEELERSVVDEGITKEEAERIRELWRALADLEDAKKVPRPLLDLEINI